MNEDWSGKVARFDRLRTLWRDQRHSYRETIIETASEQGESPDRTLMRLDSLRWMHRVSYHIWRILHHLEAAHSLAIEREQNVEVQAVVHAEDADDV